jgi:hypothetical protein
MNERLKLLKLTTSAENLLKERPNTPRVQYLRNFSYICL